MNNALRHLLLLSNKPNLYLLRDEFTTALAAGSVNGTAALPGPGERAVVDSGSNLTIAGDKLSLNGSVSADDPRCGYSTAIPRAPGRILTANIQVSVSGKVGRVGFSASPGGAAKSGIGFNAGTLASIETSVSGSRTLAAYAALTDYQVWVILRAAGHFLFVKGGVFTNATLLWNGSADSDATVYPVISQNVATGVVTSDFLRVSGILWLPAPLASDSFATAFGTTGGLGHAEASGLGAGGAGLAWTHTTYSVSSAKAINTPSPGSDVVINGAFAADTNWNKGAGWAIAAGVATSASGSTDLTAAVAPLTLGAWYQSTFDVTGFVSGTVRMVIGAATNPTHAANGTYTETQRATSTALVARSASYVGNIDNVVVKALTLAELFASVSVATADVMAEVALVVTAGTQAGLVVNLDSAATPANFVLCYHDGTNVNLVKCVAGTYTSVFATAATYSSGAVLRVTKIGTAYRAYYNSLLVNSGTISDAGIASNTLHGLFSTIASNTLDNFVVYASGSSNNEYAILDNF